MLTDLMEYRHAGALRAAQIDREHRVIHDVALITTVSANGASGRIYDDPALRDIVRLAEGVRAYLNHVSADQAFKPRDVKDLIGVHRNIRHVPAEGKVLSDLHVAEHLVPLVFGLAETSGGVNGN